MNQQKNGLSNEFVCAIAGLILGLVLGFLFEAALDALTGNVVRRGFATDARMAMLNALIGGVIGLLSGRSFGAYVDKGSDDTNSPDLS